MSDDLVAVIRGRGFADVFISIGHFDAGTEWASLADEIDRQRRVLPQSSVIRQIRSDGPRKIIIGGTADLGIVGTFGGLPVEMRAAHVTSAALNT